MTRLESKVRQLTELIEKGNTLEAMELFYADHVVLQENEEEPRTGKANCIEREQQNLKNVKETKNTLINQAINAETNVVFSEWEMIVTDKEDKKIKLTEVAVQQWENDQIVREKFYYKSLYAVS